MKLFIKIMVHFFLVLLTGGVWSCSTPQAGKATEINKQGAAGMIKNMALDQLGQLYVVTASNEVIQYRADGSPGFRYNNNTLGSLELIDPTNPFAILLFYPDFQTIVLLDRTLNEKKRLVLSSLNLLDIELVALGNDNYIWLYDAVDIQLKKYDQQGVVGFQSDRLNLLLGQTPEPAQLLAVNNRLILNDPDLGVFIFDLFGRYETTLPILSAGSLQMPDDQTLVFLRDGALFSYDLRSLRETPLNLKIDCQTGCRLQIGTEKAYWLEGGTLRQKLLPPRR